MDRIPCIAAVEESVDTGIIQPVSVGLGNVLGPQIPKDESIGSELNFDS